MLIGFQNSNKKKFYSDEGFCSNWQAENAGEELQSWRLQRQLATFDDASAARGSRARARSQSTLEGVERVPEAGRSKYASCRSYSIGYSTMMGQKATRGASR